MSASIHTALAGCLAATDDHGGSVVEMTVTLQYDEHRPFEIEMNFANAAGTDGGVTWRVSRELLVEGVTGSAGVLDILVHTYEMRGGDRTIFTLQPPRVEAAHIIVSTYSLIEFLARTEDLVPPGTEAMPLLAWPVGLSDLFPITDDMDQPGRDHSSGQGEA